MPFLPSIPDDAKVPHALAVFSDMWVAGPASHLSNSARPCCGASRRFAAAPFAGIWEDPRCWRLCEAVRQGATARLLVSFDGDGAGHLVGVDVAEVLDLAGLVEADGEGLGDRSFGDLGHGVALCGVADVEVVLDAVVAVVEGDLELLADGSREFGGVEADILPDDRDRLARAGRRRPGRHRIGAQVGVAVDSAA